MRQQLWPRLRYRWQRLDGFAQLAAVLALVNLLAWLLWLPRQQHELAALEQETAYLSGQRQAASRTAEAGANRYFPPAGSLSQVLQRIDALAARHELLIERSSGKFPAAAGQSGVQPFQLDLQVSGEYRALRGFINDTLQELPYVAIADVAFNRSSGEDAELQMPVRLRIFLSP